MKKLLNIILFVLLLGLASASADQYIGGKKASEFIQPETVTCTSDTGTATISVGTSCIVTDGGSDTNEDTVSLADGQAGQRKTFIYKTESDTGDTANITPSNLAGGTKIVFDSPGEGCVMVFDGTNWSIVANNGGSIS